MKNFNDLINEEILLPEGSDYSQIVGKVWTSFISSIPSLTPSEEVIAPYIGAFRAAVVDNTACFVDDANNVIKEIRLHAVSYPNIPNMSAEALVSVLNRIWEFGFELDKPDAQYPGVMALFQKISDMNWVNTIASSIPDPSDFADLKARLEKLLEVGVPDKFYDMIANIISHSASDMLPQLACAIGDLVFGDGRSPETTAEFYEILSDLGYQPISAATTIFGTIIDVARSAPGIVTACYAASWAELKWIVNLAAKGVNWVYKQVAEWFDTKIITGVSKVRPSICEVPFAINKVNLNKLVTDDLNNLTILEGREDWVPLYGTTYTDYSCWVWVGSHLVCHYIQDLLAEGGPTLYIEYYSVIQPDDGILPYADGSYNTWDGLLYAKLSDRIDAITYDVQDIVFPFVVPVDANGKVTSAPVDKFKRGSSLYYAMSKSCDAQGVMNFESETDFIKSAYQRTCCAVNALSLLAWNELRNSTGISLPEGVTVSTRSQAYEEVLAYLNSYNPDAYSGSEPYQYTFIHPLMNTSLRTTGANTISVEGMKDMIYRTYFNRHANLGAHGGKQEIFQMSSAAAALLLAGNWSPYGTGDDSIRDVSTLKGSDAILRYIFMLIADFACWGHPNTTASGGGIIKSTFTSRSEFNFSISTSRFSFLTAIQQRTNVTRKLVFTALAATTVFLGVRFGTGILKSAGSAIYRKWKNNRLANKVADAVSTGSEFTDLSNSVNSVRSLIRPNT